MRACFIGIRSFGLMALAVVDCARAAASVPEREGTVENDDSSGFAVVELFTSEGCSSCPPADQVLRDLAAEARRTGRRVYPLAFHVDYWNSLGWRDPYSSATWTDRQHAYARAFDQQGMYTPEMIVNGHDGFVGSNSSRSRRSVDSALHGPHGIQIDLRPKMIAGEAYVDFTVKDAPSGDVLQLAFVRLTAQTEVRAGENNGRTLRHANVVLGFRTIPLDAGRSGHASFPRTAENVGGVAIIAYVQEPETMNIRGAARAYF